MIYNSPYGKLELVKKKNMHLFGEYYKFYVFSALDRNDKTIIVREDKLKEVGICLVEFN
jgi:hypothetical protein